MIKSIERIKNKQLIIDFLKNDIGYTLFIIDGIDNVNKSYGEFEDNELKSVLLIYSNQILYYSHDKRDIIVYMDIIKDSGIKKVVGVSENVEQLKRYINAKYETDSYLLKLDNSVNYKSNHTIQEIADKESCKKLYDLLQAVDEYADTMEDKMSFVYNQMLLISNKISRVYYIEENNKIISTAGTLNEKAHSVILVGVATDKSYRNRGYASDIIRKLCCNVINDNKTVFLFYNDVIAGNIYRKIGFEEVARWKVIFI